MMQSKRWFHKCLVAMGLLIGWLFLVPISSEAQSKPTLSIDGVNNVGLDQISCPSGYNSCWAIHGANTSPNGIQIGNWYVKDIGSSTSGTVRAGVYINDLSTAGSIDKMRFSGVIMRPVTPVAAPSSKTAKIVITHTYNAGGGNPAGDYKWALGMGGWFDPGPSTETVVNDRLILNGAGFFPAGTASVNLGTLDTGVLKSSIIPDQNTSVSKSLSATTVKPACDTGSARCAPTITYTFTVYVSGSDSLVLNDSLLGVGGTCREEGPVPDVPPGTPDPLPPGPVCRGFENQLNKEIHAAAIEDMKAAKAAGAVPAETCPGSCGNGTIIIKKEVDDSPDGTFGFTGTGEDMLPAFDITTASGTGSVTFSNVGTDVMGGVRTIVETVFPSTAPGNFWRLSNVSCFNTDETNNTSWGQLFDPEDSDHLLGVQVNNLANGDTLTCTFFNSLETP